MKITELNEFNFYVGNTMITQPYMDIAATNEGIEDDGGVSSEYDVNREINNADDLIEVIEDAIRECPYDEEDIDELLTVFASESTNSVEEWWAENYG